MLLDVPTAGARLQRMLDAALALLPDLLFGSVVFAAFLILARGARALGVRVAARADRRSNLGLILGGLFHWGFVLLGALVAMSIVIPSFRASDLIELLGIGTVAIGFAFRDVLQNFFAGLLILLTQPFRLGDQIIVGPHEGTVQAIETRATTILTYDGRRVVIPNTTLFTEAVIVNTALEKRRTSYDVGIGASDDIAAARAAILRALGEVKGVLSDPPPEVLVVDLADSSVKLRVWWWTDPPNQIHVLEVQSRVLAAIKSALSAAGVDLPFPTYQILFHDQTEDTDGDRRRQREGWPAGDGKPVPAASRIGLAVCELAAAGSSTPAAQIHRTPRRSAP